MPDIWRVFKPLSEYRLVAICLIALTLVSCGGGSGGGSDTSSPATASKSINGGGIKGPLANAILIVYAFDPTKPGFKGAVIATAVTDSSAAINGLSLPLPLTPPYIMEFTSDAGTTDITTGMAPVIGTLRTVITQALLDTGEQIYATPLTTAALDIAIYNSNVTTTSGQFEAALAIAADQVVSTLGFGMPGDIDIFDLPPLIDDTTVTTAEQSDVAAYRSAIEALTAIVYLMEQQASSGSVEALFVEMTLDLADGVIDGVIGGIPSSIITGSVLTVLAQNPATLVIPNTSPDQTVADVQTILVSETATTGTTTSTTQLQAGGSITTTTQPAETSSDIDGDTVLNVNDAFPADPGETVDTDGDGVGNNGDTDDDDDGIDDATENASGDSPDHDGDGIPNREDTDSDNDGVLDSDDFDPYDDSVTLNNAPVTTNSSVTTDEDVAVAVFLNVTDDGVAPDPLTFSVTIPPTNGVLSGTAPNLTYTPNAGYSGGDSFSFTATDGGGEVSNVSTVSIAVNAGVVPVTEYRYQGPNFSSFSCVGNSICSVPDPNFTSYSTNNSVTATITLDEQLQPNLLLQDVRGLPGFSLTISDGLQELSSPDEVLLSTNADGDIVPPWSVISNGPVPPNNGAATLHWAGGRGIQDFGTLGAPTGSTPTTVQDEGYNFSGTGQWVMSGGIPPDVSTVELSPGTVSISGLGSTVQIVATAKDNGGNVIANTAFGWSSSNNTIATVSSNGVVSSVGYGTVTISAAAGNGVSSSAIITVQQVASTVQLSPVSLSFSALGDGLQVAADVTDANGNSIVNPTITWSSSNDNVATVNSTGFVTAQGNGSTTISAMIDGITSEAAVIVQQVVTAVEVNPASVAFTAFGSNQPVSAVAFDANNNPVVDQIFSWLSSDDTVSTVDASGDVTSTGNGTATVTATTGGMVAVVTVSVEQMVSTVQLTPPSLSFTALGDTQQLVADAVDSNGNSVGNISFIWSSTDDSISTVTTNGLVESHGNGTATVSASIASSTSGSANVTVDQVASNVQITPDFVTHERIGDSRQYQLSAFDVNGFAIAQPNAIWGTDNQLVADFSANGMVVTTGFGLAEISATIDNKTATATMRVSFGPPMSMLPEDWSIPTGETIGFTARLSESGEPPLVWTVNGTPAGNAIVGAIDSSGVYIAPASIPTPDTVTVRAALMTDPAVFVESPVTITSPTGTYTISRTDKIPLVLEYGVDENVLFEWSISGYPDQLDFDRPTESCPFPSGSLCSGIINALLVPVRTGVYALRFSSAELLKAYTPGDLHELVGFIECLSCTPAGIYNTRVNVADHTVPTASVTPIAADVQASSHLVNILKDPTDLSSPIPLSTTLTFYSHFPDSFDFLSLIRQSSLPGNNIYRRVRNHTSGLGLPILDFPGAYGSASKLLGVVDIPANASFDGASSLISHEIGHRWGVYLDGLPPKPQGVHWPLSDLTPGLMGQYLRNISFVQVSGNIYEVVSATPTHEYGDLQLYLMGLIGPEEVSPHPFFDDTSQVVVGNQLAANVYSIDDIIAANGARSPDHLSAPKSFSMATIILSRQGLLSDLEMSFFNHMAERAESTTELFVDSGFEAGFNKPFFLATGGRATLSTRVLP